MAELKIIIIVVIYTGIILVLYRPIWLFIGIYPLQYLNRMILKIFRSKDNKPEILDSATKYIWCTTVLNWMVYFVSPFLIRTLSGDEFTILSYYFEYSILLYALISISRTFTPKIIESNKQLSSVLKFTNWSSALIISLLT